MKRKTIFLSLAAVLVLALLALAAYVLLCGKPAIADELLTPFQPERTDTIPPTLTAHPMEVKLGERPDYMAGVKAASPYGKVTVTVDSSEVCPERAGIYRATYTAADTLGNSTTCEAAVQVYDPDRRVVYLTFDDGPSVNTPKILDILRRHGVHATFFVTAQWPKCLHYLRQEVEEGHVVAAHTYTHDFDIYGSADQYFADLERIEQVIEQHTGRRTPIIRFPGGSSNCASLRRTGRNIMVELTQQVLDRGYQYVDWNVDSHDASGNNVPVSRLLAGACHDRVRRVCLLMHDAAGKNTTVEALPAIIRYYQSRGYDFDVISTTAYTCHHAIAKE